MRISIMEGKTVKFIGNRRTFQDGLKLGIGWAKKNNISGKYSIAYGGLKRHCGIIDIIPDDEMPHVRVEINNAVNEYHANTIDRALNCAVRGIKEYPRKYELTGDVRIITVSSHRECKLYRIRALKSFGHIKKGDLGGFIESENNLAHKGHCWVANDAHVWGNAEVSGNAKVADNAMVHGDVFIAGNAQIYGNAQIHGMLTINGHAQVFGGAIVKGFGDGGHIQGFAKICGKANLNIVGKLERFGGTIF